MAVKSVAPRRPKSRDDSPKPLDSQAALCIAGIGASAGGYEAIRNLLLAMPVESGIAFVVVQHLDPSYTSMAAELFAKCTAMPVCEAVDGMVLEANHVYTSPSDKELAIKNGCFRLTPRKSLQHLHLPIDHFFSSLGEDCRARAIGIVLSGTGTDGTLGLKVIAANGGIVLAQDPGTAQFDGMPNSAIAAGVANHVLAVDKMPEVLLGYAHHPYVAGNLGDAQNEQDARAVESLIGIINAKHGYDFAGYKRPTLLRRIQRRMGLLGVLQMADYAEVLAKNPSEADALFRDLMIGVTEFFRDVDAWRALDNEVIAPLVASKHSDEPIRIWIPACSTGEEAYTMAMVILDRLHESSKRCPLQIFATDTNNHALEVGRCGRYPIGIASRITEDRLHRYFIEERSGEHYTVSPELRSVVVFGVQNLFSDPPFARVDLISCRNVLIYLEPEVQKRVLGIFHFALRAGASLFLGNAESASSQENLFKPISKTFRLYRREDIGRVDTLAVPFRIGELPAAVLHPKARALPPPTQAASVAQKMILDHFSPASVLTNSRYEALYFCGPTEDFMIHPRGAPTQDLLALVREGLRSRLRGALRQAATSDATVTVADARMKDQGGFSPVEITVTPNTGGGPEQFFLVVFKHVQTPRLTISDNNAEQILVRQLEGELQATRDDLQSTVERFETATEELKVSNEEVISVNEELRSLNEELQSSKEELQSLNEELTTVNQQLEAKLRELEVSNNDLKNLLNSSDIATICLDTALCIKWFTPATEKQLNLISGDIGRPISDFSGALIGQDLIEAATSVLAQQTVSHHEFQNKKGRWYIRRTLPYLTGEKVISGVIVTYIDVTDSHLAREAASASGRDLDESRQTNEKLRALSAALAFAEERERRALAQDLHDDLGQILAVIKLKAVAIDKMKMSAAMRDAVKECIAVVDQANRKLRAMAFHLSPPMLYELGLVPALEWVGDEMRHMYRLDVKTEDDGKPKPMDKAVSATLFRAVRELLINVAKHASVNSAKVSTARGEGDTIVITVSDTGVGFDPEAPLSADTGGGFGLLSMRERLGYLGGGLSVESQPGKGTSIALRAPLLPIADMAATRPVPAPAVNIRKRKPSH